MIMVVPYSVCPSTVRLTRRLSTQFKEICIGLSIMLVVVGDAWSWSPSGCGGTDGLGILVVVSASIYAGRWSMSSSGSSDGFSTLASVVVVVDAVIWSPL